jgi:hypothetical protein
MTCDGLVSSMLLNNKSSASVLCLEKIEKLMPSGKTVAPKGKLFPDKILFIRFIIIS